MPGRCPCRICVILDFGHGRERSPARVIDGARARAIRIAACSGVSFANANQLVHRMGCRQRGCLRERSAPSHLPTGEFRARIVPTLWNNASG